VVTQIITDALKDSYAFMFRVKRRIINDDFEGSSFVRKRDIPTALHGVHPKKQWSSVLAVFVNGLT
jgi:hypothetical protein